MSCNSKPNRPEALIGKWKMYDIKINKKDISKSSDPTNVNGLEFQANGNYISFGNPNHEDQGVYEVKENDLLFRSEKMAGSSRAQMILAQDTLQLEMRVDSTKTLFMKLYRMK